MGYKLITQIVLLILSVAVIVMYIKPELTAIKAKQDDTFAYKDASAKIGDLNSQLNALVSKSNSFSSSNISALETYLPSAVDSVVVMSDITAMVENSGSKLISLTATDVVQVSDTRALADPSQKVDPVVPADFALTMEGTYDQLKQALRSFEQNNYPLEIVSLDFSEFVPESADTVVAPDMLEGSFELVLRTYSYSYTRN